MSPSSWDRAEEALIRDLNEGRLTQAEFNAEMRDLARDYREMAEESARDAHDREMERW